MDKQSIYSIEKNANQRHKYKIQNTSDITNEHWNKFEQSTDLPIENIDHYLNINNLDQLWYLIRFKTISTANEYFPKVRKSKNKITKHNFIKYKPASYLNKLSRIIRKLKVFINNLSQFIMQHINFHKIDNFIKKLNN